jgi:uncharacterized SAM-binding protein YcdF (DUF218 family)
MIKLIRVILVLLTVTVGLPLLLWGGGFIVFTGVISSMTEPREIGSTDAIIVLTGGTNRVSRGLELLREKKSQHLLISGVHKDVKLEELLDLWGYKDDPPKCCITLGREAGNTLGNALEARAWVRADDFATIRVITATYHMPRTLLEFRHALPDRTIIPHPVIPEGFGPQDRKFWRICFLEYHKLLVSLYRILFFPSEVTPLPEPLKSTN